MKGINSHIQYEDSIDKEYTTIKIRKGMKAQLDLVKMYPESWDDYLLRLLECYESSTKVVHKC